MDEVNHPSHYKNGSVEAIDAIESALGPEQFKGYCIGNAIKYLYRWENKGGKQDLEKARWYINRILEDK